MKHMVREHSALPQQAYPPANSNTLYQTCWIDNAGKKENTSGAEAILNTAIGESFRLRIWSEMTVWASDSVRLPSRHSLPAAV